MTLLGNRIEHLAVLNEKARHNDRCAEVRRVGVGVDPISNLIEYRLLVISVPGRLGVEVGDLPGYRVESAAPPAAFEGAELLLDDAVPLQDVDLDPLGELKVLGPDLFSDSYRVHRQFRDGSGDDALPKRFDDRGDRRVELRIESGVLNGCCGDPAISNVSELVYDIRQFKQRVIGGDEFGTLDTHCFPVSFRAAIVNGERDNLEEWSPFASDGLHQSLFAADRTQVSIAGGKHDIRFGHCAVVVSLLVWS